MLNMVSAEISILVVSLVYVIYSSLIQKAAHGPVWPVSRFHSSSQLSLREDGQWLFWTWKSNDSLYIDSSLKQDLLPEQYWIKSDGD